MNAGWFWEMTTPDAEPDAVYEAAQAWELDNWEDLSTMTQPDADLASASGRRAVAEHVMGWRWVQHASGADQPRVRFLLPEKVARSAF